MRILYTFLVFLLSVSSSFAASYTWTGTTSTAWNVSTNWSPSGVPGTADNVTIVSTTNTPVLDAARTVVNFTISSGSLDLNTYTLTITGNSTFNGGKIQNGTVNSSGTTTPTATYAGTIFGDITPVTVIANCGNIYLNGSTFYGPVDITKTSSTNNVSTGGNTFHSTAKIRSNGSGVVALANVNGDTFNSTLTLINSTAVEFSLARNGTTQFNGDIYVNQTATGTIYLGYHTGTTGISTLATGKGIYNGSDGGFTNGILYFKNFTYSGTVPFNLTTTNGSVNFNTGNTFACPITITSPYIYLNGSTFNGAVDFTKSGGNSFQSNGGNIFNSTFTYTNLNNITVTLSNVTKDIYNSTATFNNKGSVVSNIAVAANGTNTEFNGDIVINQTSQGTISFGSGTGTSALAASKTITIGTNGGFTNGFVSFKNFTYSNTSALSFTTASGGVSFQSGSVFNCPITISAAHINLNGTIFNGAVSFTKTGGNTTASTGGNTFNAAVTLTNSSVSEFRNGTANADIFNAPLTLNNTSSGILAVAYNSSNNQFDDITFNPAGSGSIVVGNVARTNSFGNGTTVSAANTTGLGTIQLLGVTLPSSNPLTLNLGCSASLNLTSCTFNSDLNLRAGFWEIKNNTFNSPIIIEKCGGAQNTNSQLYGGNNFSTTATAHFINSGLGNLNIAASSPDVYNSDVTLTSSATNYLNIGTLSAVFNGNIIINKSAGGYGITIGGTNTSTLASGKTISFGSVTNASSWNLVIKRINQLGVTPQVLRIETGLPTNITINNSTFEAPVDIKSANLGIQNNTFNNTSKFERYASSGAYDALSGATGVSGGNIFNEIAEIINSGTAHWLTGTSSSTKDIFNKDLIISSTNNGNISIAHNTANNEFNGNIIVNNTGTGTIQLCTGTSGSATLAEGKSILVGTSGFSNGHFSINRLTQLGSTLQPIEFTGTANINILYSTFNASVDIKTPSIASLRGNTFEQPVRIEKTGTTANTLYGENLFKSTLEIKNSSTVALIFGNNAADTYNGDVTSTITNSGSLYLAYVSPGNNFNGDIIVNSTGSGTIAIGSGASTASATLAAGKTIKVGTLGFGSGTLSVNRLTQQGSTPISITSTGTSTLNISNNNTLNGALNLTVPNINFSGTGSVYNGSVIINAATLGFTAGTAAIFNGSFQATVSNGGLWYGALNFYGDVTLTYNGNTGATNNLRLASGATDLFKFYGNLTLNRNTSWYLWGAYAGTVEHYKNLTYNDIATTAFNEFNHGGGLCKFVGSVDQTINSNKAALIMNRLTVDKPAGNLILNIPVNILVTAGASPTLTLTKGNIVTTTTNILTLCDGITLAGGSVNSFISGPVKKIGNDAFTFPLGKGSVYAPLAISAPSATTDEFTAEAFVQQTPNSTNLDGTLKDVSNCQFWNFRRTLGTSNIQLTLPWNSTTCTAISPSYMKVAKWDGTNWTNAGANNLVNTPPIGSITSNTLTSYGLYTLGSDQPLAVTAAKTDPCFGQTNGTVTLTVTGGRSPYTYLWSNSATTKNLSGLAAGTYDVTVTDALGATQTASATLTASSAITVVLDVNGQDIQSSVNGGTSPYTYLWSNAGTAANQTSLVPGNYSVTVTDINGCASIAEATVLNPLSPIPVELSAKGQLSLRICNDTVWAWGANGAGGVGDGTTINKTTPVKIGIPGAVAVAGGQHTLALKNDGSLWAWGRNDYGQVGNGTTSSTGMGILNPVQVSGLSDVVAISGGDYFSLALKADGTVWAWGMNFQGLLGDGTSVDRNTPVKVTGLSGIVAIAAGSNHSLALKNDGTVWAWGLNSVGVLGDGTTINRNKPVKLTSLANIVKIAAGSSHSFAWKADGTLWSWGWNALGQLGDGTKTNRTTPTLIATIPNIKSLALGDYHTLILKSDNSVWATGNNSQGEFGDGTFTEKTSFVQIANLVNIKAIATGVNHSLFLRNDGVLMASGNNGNGQIGDGGNNSARNIPVSVYASGGCFKAEDAPETNQTIAAGENHSARVCADGTLWTWGYNNYGQLGVATTGSYSTKPLKVQGLSNVKSVSVGNGFTVVLKEDGTVWSWGLNNNGQLGNGNNVDQTSPVQVIGLTDIVAISSNITHTLALKRDGTVWAWGVNYLGQIGDGTIHGGPINQPIQVQGIDNVVKISCGYDFSLALKRNGTVWAWGSNDFGELGTATYLDPGVPTQVPDISDVKDIAGGILYALAVKKDGTVWKWGNTSLFVTASSPSPIQIPDLSNVATVNAGYQSLKVLKNDGSLWALGFNGSGQIGNGTNIDASSPVQIFGSGQITEVAMTSVSTISLKNDGTIWGWGANTVGNLGDGTTSNKNAPSFAYAAGGCFVPTSCLVTNTSDSGTGSLRDAINCANTQDVHTNIQFAIPGAGPYTINCLSTLPALLNTAGITIDGASQIASQTGSGDQSITLQNARFNLIEGSNTLAHLNFISGQGMYIQSSGNILDSLIGDHTGPIVVETGGNNTIVDCNLANPNSPVIVLSSGTGHNEITTTKLRGEGSPSLIVYSNENSIRKNHIYNNKAHALIITDNSANNIVDSLYIKRETFLGATDTVTYFYYAAGVLLDGSDVAYNTISNTTINGFNYGIHAGSSAHHNNIEKCSASAIDYGLFINGSNNTVDSSNFYALYADRSRIGAVINSNSNIISNNRFEGFTADGILLNYPGRNNSILNNDVIGTDATLYPASASISGIGPFGGATTFTTGGIVNHSGYNTINNNYIEKYYSGIRITMDSAIVQGNIIGRTGAIGVYVSNGTYDYNSRIEGNYVGFNKDLTNSLITGVGIGFYGANGITVSKNRIGNIQRFSTSDPLNGSFVGNVVDVDGSGIAGLYGGGQNIRITENIIGENSAGTAAPIQNIGINLNNKNFTHVSSVKNSFVLKNKVRNSVNAGIEIGSNEGMIVSGNDISGGNYGLKILSTSSNIITNNSFKNHTVGSVYLDQQGGGYVSGYDYYLTRYNYISRNTYSRNTLQKNINLSYGDPAHVANEDKQPPVLTTITEGSSITIDGTALAGDTIEIYQGVGVGNAKTYTYITSVVATSTSWTITFPGSLIQGGVNSVFTATATDEDGNTSEFGNELSSCFACCIVTNTDDTGTGSLREAVSCANAKSTHAYVQFAIPVAGPYEIELASPVVVTNPYGVTIDGNTQALSGVGSGDQTVAVKNSMFVFDTPAGPSNVANLSFSDYPFGVFSLADSISIHDNKFNGSGTRVILSSTPNARKVDVINNIFEESGTAFDGEGINELNILNNTINAPAGGGSISVYVRNSNTVTIRNNSFDNILSAVYATNNKNLIIRNNDIKTSLTNAGTGINVANSRRVYIDTNSLLGRAANFTGIIVNQCDTGTVNKNSIRSVNIGLHYSIANDFTFDNNTILNYTDGIIYNNNFNQRLTISNNTIRNGTGTGILAGGYYISVTNNYIDTCGIGIRTVGNQGVLNNSVFAYNQIYNFSNTGISFGQGMENGIHNNIIGKGVGNGIHLFRGHDNLIIRNNFIGISPQLASLPIQGHGIVIAMTNPYGGPVIKYNHIGNISTLSGSAYGESSGIYCYGGGVSLLSVENNYIGTDSLKNMHIIGKYGIRVLNGPVKGIVQNNLIGNTDIGLKYETSSNNLIKGNYIFNLIKAIEISSETAPGLARYNRITENDYVPLGSPIINLNLTTPQEANEGKSVPTIASFKLSNGEAIISGQTEAGDIVEIYQATGTFPKTYSFLSSVVSDPQTGFWIAYVPQSKLKNINQRTDLYATATDANNNTSQFGSAFSICPVCECMVTTIADAGEGSLREAINCANSIGNGAKVKFNIPANLLDTIRITSSTLPAFSYNVEVDGTSQPGFAAGQSPKIFIKNELTEPNSYGLVFTYENSVVRGIGMKNFTPAFVLASNAHNSEIEYCTVINNGGNIAVSGQANNCRIMGSYFGVTHNGDGSGSNSAPGLVINNGIIGSKEKPNVIANYYYGGIWGDNVALYNIIYNNGDPATKKGIYSPSRIPGGHTAVLENYIWKIKGTTVPANSRIQLFLNNGIQQQALAFVDELFADASGNWSFTVPTQYLPKNGNSYFVYTYTAPGGLTSELSSVITVGTLNTQCFVTNTNDNGPGSLRYAINTCANPAPNHAEIIFQLPDTDARVNGNSIPSSRTINIVEDYLNLTNPNGITLDGGAAWVKLKANNSSLYAILSSSSYNANTKITRILFDGDDYATAISGFNLIVTDCEIIKTGYRSINITGQNNIITNNYIHGNSYAYHEGAYFAVGNSVVSNNYFGIDKNGNNSSILLNQNGVINFDGGSDNVTIQNNTFVNIDSTEIIGSRAAILVKDNGYTTFKVLNNTIGKFNGNNLPVNATGIYMAGFRYYDAPTHDLVYGNTIENCIYGIRAQGNGDTLANNTFRNIKEVAILNIGRSSFTIYPGDRPAYLTKNLIFSTPAGKTSIVGEVDAPVITSFDHGDWDWLIQGTSIPDATIELFLSDGVAGNAVQYLQTIKADGTGNWSLTVPEDDINVNQQFMYITATATTTDYSTSGLSNIGTLEIKKCVVTNDANSGANTLRECIDKANLGDINYITFNIPAGSLPVEIELTSLLPTITTNAKGLIINGNTQPGTLASSDYNKIIVKAAATLSYGFTIGNVTGVALRNISVKNFTTAGLYYTSTANRTKAEHIEISGHNASGAGVRVDNSCGIKVRVSNSRIKGNNTGQYGVYNLASGSYFDKLTIVGHRKAGIYSEGTVGTPLTNVTIKEDTLRDNYPSGGIGTQTDYTGGIVLKYTNSSAVSGCVSADNNYGLFVGLSSNNRIDSNSTYRTIVSETLTTYSGNGVAALHTLNAASNTFSDNEFSYSMAGIRLNSSNNTKILRGAVSNNMADGIAVYSSTGTQISSVDVLNNQFDGIEIDENSGQSRIQNCNIGSRDTAFASGSGNMFFGINLLSSQNYVADNIIGYNEYGAVNVKATANQNKIVRNFLFPSPSNPTALSININTNGNTGITPPTITGQISSGKYITLSGGGVDDGDSVHVYRNRGYFEEANFLLAAVKAVGNTWSATVDTTLLFDGYSAYIVATTTDANNNTSQLSSMYSLGYCMVNTQDDNGDNIYPTNASLRMAVNCLNSSQVSGRLMVNIDGYKNPVINLKGSVLNPIVNPYGVDMSGRNKFYTIIKDTRTKVQMDETESEALGDDYVFEVTDDVQKVNLRNFILNNGKGLKAEADTLKMELMTFTNPYTDLVNNSYAPVPALPVAATSQGAWVSGSNLVTLHKVSMDGFSNSIATYEVDKLKIDSSSFNNSVVGLWASKASDSIYLFANQFTGNKSAGMVAGPLNSGKTIIETNTFSGQGIGLALINANKTHVFKNTFNSISVNESSSILNSANENGIGIFVLDSTGTLSIENNSFNKLLANTTAIDFDKDAVLGSLPYNGFAYPDSVEVYNNKVSSDTFAVAVNIKGRRHSIHHNTFGASILTKDAKRSVISENTLFGRNGFVNMTTSDSVIVSKNLITGFFGRNDSKSIHLNYETSDESNGGKRAPLFDGSSLVEHTGRMRVAISGKSDPNDDVELFKSDTLNPYLISFVTTVTADGNGDWSYIVPTDKVPIKKGDFYIATATAPDTMRTSEASGIFYLGPQKYDIIVRNTNDQGPNSLRNALNLVTIYDPFVNVKFEIPGNGPYRILIDSSYRAVTSENGFTLDVNTQTDFAIGTTGLSYDDDLRVILDGSHLKETPYWDTAAVEVKKGPNDSYIRALNIENFKRGYLLKSNGFRLSSLTLHNNVVRTNGIPDDLDYLAGAAIELDSTTAEEIALDSINVDNFGIAFLLGDTIGGGNSVTNADVEWVNTGVKIDDCDRVKVTNNIILNFAEAGIHWIQRDTVKVKTKEEDFAEIKDNYIGFHPYNSNVTASTGSGIILDGVKEETFTDNYIGNLSGDVNGIDIIGNAQKLVIKANYIGDDGYGNVKTIQGNGIRLMSDGDTLTENFISENYIKGVSGAGIMLHGTRGNMVAANIIGDTSLTTNNIGYGVIVKGYHTTHTAANERIYDNKIFNYTQDGIYSEYADSVTINRNILITKVGLATSKGINLNVSNTAASNNRKLAPVVTDMNVVNASTMEISGDGIAGEKIELFTTIDANTLQALIFAGHTVVGNDNRWKITVYPPFLKFDKPMYVVATATDLPTGRTSELSIPKEKTRALCDLESDDLLPALTSICPADKYIADLKLNNESNSLTYEWSLNGSIIGYLTNAKADLNKEGDYTVIIKDQAGAQQCTVTVAMKLEYIDAPYEPKLLMATEVIAGDTILAYDVADEEDFNLSDIVFWTKDPSVLVWDIDPLEPQRKFNMVFPAPGTYEITITTKNDGPCTEKETKTITVFSEASLKELQSGMPTELINVTAYPNPSDGDFAVKVELNQWDDIYLDMYNTNGVLIYSIEKHMKKQHVFGIPSEDFAAGMYYVSVRAGSMREIVKVVLVK